MRLKRLTVTGTMVLALAGAGLATAAPANAAVSCHVYDVCFYYNSSFEGAIWKTPLGQIPDHAGYKFSTSTAPRGSNGAGQYVKNNAASVDNSDPDYWVTVYYNSNYNGNYAYQTISKWSAENLNATMKNNNASHKKGG